MATVPNLPLFFKDLVPLQSTSHSDWKIQTQSKAPFLVGQHAIPVTIDEFVSAGRCFPIVFSSGTQSVPLALMGLNEGINVFVDDEGAVSKPVYIPAYIRRYPFLLAKLRADTDELSLCFDPSAPGVGPDIDGNALFEDGQPSAATNAILDFCRQFEEAGLRTAAFMEELNKLDIMMDGEVSIQADGQEKPYVYRGFRMVDEEKLKDLRGDTLRKISQNGILPLLYAHLFSLQMMREVFGEQISQGKMPAPDLLQTVN